MAVGTMWVATVALGGLMVLWAVGPWAVLHRPGARRNRLRSRRTVSRHDSWS